MAQLKSFPGETGLFTRPNVVNIIHIFLYIKHMNHIDKIFYINLERRIDRRLLLEREFLRMDLSGERFPAIEDTIGMIGCGKSHLAVLKLAKERGYKNILILEDDFEFLVDKEIFEKEISTFFSLKMDYDVLMLSYNCVNNHDYTALESTNVFKVNSAQTTSGYIVNEHFYDILIKCFEEGLDKLIETNNQSKYSLDQYWKILQPRSKWFGFCKRIGKQRSSYSDIENRYVNYGV